MISQEKADAIRALADDNGFIEPSDIVAAARNPDHVLHDEFQWDLRSAAEAHWLDTARHLVRLVKVEVVIDEKVIRSVGYVVDPDRPTRSRRYIDLTVAATNRVMAQEILADEMTRITAAIRRAQEIATVLHLRTQFSTWLDGVRGVVDAAETALARARAQVQARKEKAATKAKGAKKKRGRPRRAEVHA
jgi:hypothetical protein